MEGKIKEGQRALNIIWNASNNYSLNPELKAYNRQGRADLYWNYIIGAVYKYYDYYLLNDFFDTLKYDRDYIFYQQIMFLAFESSIYNQEKKDRPALVNLRYNYAKRAVDNRPVTVYDEISNSYFSRVLGYEVKARDNINSLLDDLYFDLKLNIDEVIYKMQYILEEYFEPEYSKDFYFKRLRRFNILGRKATKIYTNFSKKRNILSFDGDSKNNDGKEGYKSSNWVKYKEKRASKERDFIERYFGISEMGEKKTKAIEKILCSSNHQACHLHFTRGEFKDSEDPMLRNKITSAQREKNKKHYKDNYISNKINILLLSQKIKNALSNQSFSIKSERGKLIADKIWRTYLKDYNIFIKKIEEEPADLSVDIMLDASASQLNRQEIIATEAYIIAESLTRCNIPVRVYSFCNMRDYTVINTFRDYNQVKSNDKIFNYYAAGFNRDGMAIRTSLYMMENTNYRHKILIVLSDGKPNDILAIPTEGLFYQREYSSTIAVKDTAKEVRKGLKQGVSILCVFTGKDKDIPSVKKIYGKNFVRIKTIEKFAETVGLLIEKELSNL
ncbi:MAG: hypothetical protein GX339_01145 [Tissierellia bacterium]|nr:hypothetical protein [Tissierellia bacterium]